MTRPLFTRVFWADTLERAIKTVAQSAVALVTAGQIITDIDWQTVVGVSATAGVVSVLTSIASGRVGDPATASALPPPTT